MCLFHIEEKLAKHFHFDLSGQEQAHIRILYFCPMPSICLKLMDSVFFFFPEVYLMFAYISLHDVWWSLLLFVDAVPIEDFIQIYEQHIVKVCESFFYNSLSA